jgi:hypothetical protein
MKSTSKFKKSSTSIKRVILIIYIFNYENYMTNSNSQNRILKRTLEF